MKKPTIHKKLGSYLYRSHAIGGAAWIWALQIPAQVWNNLIPIVIAERLLFAVGIAGSYLVIKHVLAFLVAKHILPKLDIMSSH